MINTQYCKCAVCSRVLSMNASHCVSCGDPDPFLFGKLEKCYELTNDETKDFVLYIAILGVVLLCAVLAYIYATLRLTLAILVFIGGGLSKYSEYSMLSGSSPSGKGRAELIIAEQYTRQTDVSFPVWLDMAKRIVEKKQNSEEAAHILGFASKLSSDAEK